MRRIRQYSRWGREVNYSIFVPTRQFIRFCLSVYVCVCVAIRKLSSDARVQKGRDHAIHDRCKGATWNATHENLFARGHVCSVEKASSLPLLMLLPMPQGERDLRLLPRAVGARKTRQGRPLTYCRCRPQKPSHLSRSFRSILTKNKTAIFFIKTLLLIHLRSRSLYLSWPC